MEFELIVEGIIVGLLGLSAYSQYKRKKIAERANARTKAFEEERGLLIQQFQEQYRETTELGLPVDEVCRLYLENIKKLSRKHNLVTLVSNTSIPGKFEAQREVYNNDGTIERYVSNGNKWIRYE